MKRIVIVFLFLANTACFAQTKGLVDYFHLSDVRLLEGPFKTAEENNLKYILAMNPDRLMAPFRREAGLSSKAESYTNWENTGLDGHMGGHYLSALSLMFASTGDHEIKARLNYMIDELKFCQDANGNGYIGGVPGGKEIWEEIGRGNIHSEKFNLNGEWVPLYNIHKTFSGLRDAWLYTQNKTAKEMLIKMTDWAFNLVAQLSEDQVQDMLRCEYGGLNEIFADVAAIAGDKKYIELASKFSHQDILLPLLNKEDRLEGLHANTQIPKVIGFKRIADIVGDKDLSEAAAFFWNTVVENRSVCIGGNSSNEQFHAKDDFSKMINGTQGLETCNTYNMLRLSKMLYQTTKNKKYIEYYEQALYNHILSSQHPDNGGLVYFTPMRPGHYRVYSQPETSMWCCVGSGIENHSKYGEMIYAHTDNELYVNLFIPSHLTWKEKNVEILQENSFPEVAKTTLTVNPVRKTNFVLKIRYPDWVGDREMKIRINGKVQVIDKKKDGYVAFDRKWQAGDKVEVELPMHIQVEQLPDKSAYYSFIYGPIVLAAKTGTEDLRGLYADDSRKGHEAGGRRIPFIEMPVLVSDPNKIVENITPILGLPLTFRLSNLYPEEKWGELQLVPFFRIHDSRYIIYWPQATVEEVAAQREEKRKQELEEQRLDTITIERIDCGQQQPESDHFIQMENSNTGYTESFHWRREAEGWFSYQLDNKDQNAEYLYFSHFDKDEDRQFDIFINDCKIGFLRLSGEHEAHIFERKYRIPDEMKDIKTLTVRFEGKGGRKTAKIIEVRLLNDKTQNSLKALHCNEIAPVRKRVYVLTDISSLESSVGEPDDTQSLIRFLLYANEFEIEGFGATYTSHRDTIYPQYIKEVLSAYDKSINSLRLHGDFPDAQTLADKIKRGMPGKGTKYIGNGQDTELSEHIIAVLKKNHDQPLWILVWGGSIDLAQALWKIRETMPVQDAQKLISALRVYSILDQYDTAGGWIRDNFKDLFFILCNGSFRGMYRTGDTSLVSSQWVKDFILTIPAPLAQMYPDYKGKDPWGNVDGIKEGDTPSFFYLLPGSRGNPDNPESESWGGKFKRIEGTNHFIDCTIPEALSCAGNVSKWRRDFQADFKMRLNWLIQNEINSNNQ